LPSAHGAGRAPHSGGGASAPVPRRLQRGALAWKPRSGSAPEPRRGPGHRSRCRHDRGPPARRLIRRRGHQRRRRRARSSAVAQAAGRSGRRAHENRGDRPRWDVRAARRARTVMTDAGKPHKARPAAISRDTCDDVDGAAGEPSARGPASAVTRMDRPGPKRNAAAWRRDRTTGSWKRDGRNGSAWVRDRVLANRMGCCTRV
jgi:hypothetical protein